MYDHQLHQQINNAVHKQALDVSGDDNAFYLRFVANASEIRSLYDELYVNHPEGAATFASLLNVIVKAYANRKPKLKSRDFEKQQEGNWFLSNKLAGMSLYVDRFCGDIKSLEDKLGYFESLGVNVLHLMPLFESPANESDGGYAVSDYRKVDKRFGTLDDFKLMQQQLHSRGFYLMTDIVLNHTSQQHTWAIKARQGDRYYQDFFYMYDDHVIPSQFEATMPEIFPGSSPGNFTYISECSKWVMTVFHEYQWDLNYTNPRVLTAMLENIFFYANLGVDILRIDAPAFIWKEIGTSSQNLPKAHSLLRLVKQCVSTATPGMALLAEAIVAPKYIMEYFGTGRHTGRECDLAYNATHMAVQWDALATADTRVMLAAQHEISLKPFGTSWINYVRCHDDIGLGYDDHMISVAGFSPYEHRRFIKDYFSGNYPGSLATGALFSFNPQTNDARISGSLASLCGLEKATDDKNSAARDMAIAKLIMMQAHSLFLGGIPMLYYGDEVAYTNDYSYHSDASKNYDNRWMHRPLINWEKNNKKDEEGTIEQVIFNATRKLLAIRRSLPVVADYSNIKWWNTHNKHIAAYMRYRDGKRLYCVFNFSGLQQEVSFCIFDVQANQLHTLYDHWREEQLRADDSNQMLALEPYGFCLLELKD